MKKHRWTQERQRQFLDYLGETGNVFRSVKLVGTSPARVYALRKTDPGFRRAWDEAEEIACARLEAEAWRRAVEGWDEPALSAGRLVKDEDGNPVALRRYSDALLAMLLKAHRPHKYDRRAAAGLPAPGALAIDVRAALLAKLAQLAAATPQASPADAAPADAPEPAPPLLEHSPPEDPA